MKQLIMLLFAITTSSCIYYNPDKMLQSERNECIILENDLVILDKRGIGFLWEDYISAGTYKSVYEDKKGIFFAGTGRPIAQTMLSGKKSNNNTDIVRMFEKGGIWIPKDKSSKPRLYTIFEANPSNNAQIAQTSTDIAMSQPVSPYDPATAGLGGAIGGGIIQAIAKADDGKMLLLPYIRDPAAMKKVLNIKKCDIEQN